MYFVIGQDGRRYGPADLQQLAQWASEGRVTAATRLEDARTGEPFLAASIPGALPGVDAAGTINDAVRPPDPGSEVTSHTIIERPDRPQSVSTGATGSRAPFEPARADDGLISVYPPAPGNVLSGLGPGEARQDNPIFTWQDYSPTGPNTSIQRGTGAQSGSYSIPGPYAPAGGFGRQDLQHSGLPVYAGGQSALDLNTSGTMSMVPDEIQRMPWNWGAFAMTPIWCFSHGMIGLGFAAMLTSLLGPAGFIIPIYLGVSGNKLAWQNRRFSGIDHFRQVQDAWARWGVGALSMALLLMVLALAMS